MAIFTYLSISLVLQFGDRLDDLVVDHSLLMPLCPLVWSVADSGGHQEVLILAQLGENLGVSHLSSILHKYSFRCHLGSLFNLYDFDLPLSAYFICIKL